MKQKKIFLQTQTLIPITLLGLIYISSFLFLNLSKSLISLRFLGDEFEQIIDSGLTSKSEFYFYKSPSVLVFPRQSAENILSKEIAQEINSFLDTGNVRLSFSNDNLKNKFFDDLLKSEVISEKALDVLQAKSTSIVSKGKICFHQNCLSQFIAISKIIKPGV